MGLTSLYTLIIKSTPCQAHVEKHRYVSLQINHNEFYQVESIWTAFSDHIAVKLEINYNNKK